MAIIILNQSKIIIFFADRRFFADRWRNKGGVLMDSKFCSFWLCLCINLEKIKWVNVYAGDILGEVLSISVDRI